MSISPPSRISLYSPFTAICVPTVGPTWTTFAGRIFYDSTGEGAFLVPRKVHRLLHLPRDYARRPSRLRIGKPPPAPVPDTGFDPLVFSPPAHMQICNCQLVPMQPKPRFSHL